MSRTSVSRKRRAALLAPAALVALLALAGSLSSATGSTGAAQATAETPATHFTVTEGNNGHRQGDHDQTEYNTKA
ncbi:hypothetical protein [Streptomyces hesseae]|uniref:Uncharacterized protein n=1 Tax=Streptomyces hesseae TaxID=3075519 RepID=A0ABU2SH13_9ACTN|nr:hypothetical protein [Streptomyces sp. DSM 40473]MDT0448262.1 hypothetical protein [Streptomyces sp. DSM 40473]